MKKILNILFILFICFSIVSCKKKDNDDNNQNQQKPAVELTLEKSEVTIEVGETYVIKPTLKNFEGNDEYNVVVEDNTIATSTGLTLSGVNAGTTKVTVSLKSDEKVKASLTLTVTQIIAKPIPEIIVTSGDADIYVGDTINLAYEVKNANIEDVKIEIEDETIISKDFVALKEGTTKITFYVEGYLELAKVVTITVDKREEPFVPTLYVDIKEIELTEEDTYTLVITTNVEGENVYTVSADNSNVTVSGNVLTAVKEGTSVVTVKLNDYDLEVKVNVKVNKKFVPTLDVDIKEIELTEEDTYTLVITTNVEGENVYTVTVDNSNVTVSGNVLTAVKEGTSVVTVKLNDYDLEVKVKVIINKLIVDETAPQFELDGVSKNVTLNWNKEFDAYKGVKATDDIDGDVTNNIKVIQNVDNRKYGEQTVIYEVKDNAGNTAQFERTVKVIWDYAVQFIGHQGSYYGVANSEESFLYGAKVLQYQALECDVKQTKDGVFVTCHDDTFAGITISSVTYEELKDVVKNESRSSGYPAQNGEMPGDGKYSSTICTLERYLEICKEYGCIAVIELKGSPGISNSDQSRMPALMELIEQEGMLEQTIFLASAYNCLIWVKQNGYDYIPCQYLVDSFASESIFNRCVTYGLDVSGCVTYGNGQTQNTPEWVARYQDAGIKVSTYTFTQYSSYEDVQKWIDIGVDFVTVDWHTMHKLNLPDNSDIVYHTVKFYDHENNLLKETKVKSGRAAAAPFAPEREGYAFKSWSNEITNITEDLEVYAIYEPVKYTITYDNNLYKVSRSTWATKEDFVNEFYTDLFEWIKLSAGKVTGITYSNGKYKVSLSGATATFASVEELLTVDIYDFEKTLGPKIYKPISGSNSDDYVPLVDSTYFLNTEPYRTKYIEMNKYFLDAIKKGYSAYDNTYTPTSNGRVQIMFRFHQWAKGYNNSAFNTLPGKYIFKYATGIEATMPTDHVTYTIESEFELSNPVASIEFLGWYLDKDATGERITKIEKGSTGDIILYAKWEEFVIPDVYSNVTYELDGGTNNPNNKATYLEGVSTTLHPATKVGYDFLGWSLEENSTTYVSSIKETQTGDITLYANFEYSKYSVKYELQGGSWGNKVEFTGSPVTQIETTDDSDFWNGYASNIYLFEAKEYSSGTNATWSDRIGISMDETVGTYVVKVYAASGKSFDYSGCDYIIQISSSYSKYSSTAAFRKAVAVGQVVRFVGDTTTGVATVEFYTTDCVSGGTIENFVTEYTIANLPVLLPIPKQEGKVFKGWALSATSTDVFTSIPEGTTGDLTLYAIWE